MRRRKILKKYRSLGMFIRKILGMTFSYETNVV